MEPGERGVREVIHLLPDFHLGRQDLEQNPKFTKLLLCLTDHLDTSGLSLSVRRELEKAQSELRLQKHDWFQAEAIERVLQEMVTGHQVTRWENSPSTEDRQFFETLERCEVLAACRRRVDTRESVRGDSRPPLLGLEGRHLLQLLPGAQELQAMMQRLVLEVEERLKQKCFAVLGYGRPESDSDSEELKMQKCANMAEMFERDNQRVESERAKGQQNQRIIESQSIAYLTVLYRSLVILQELVVRHRLGSQPELDASVQNYLKLKSKAMFTKLGLMKLELRHQLFDQDMVETHQRIREVLEQEFDTQRRRARDLRGTLGLYQILGSDFEELVGEYSRLRELLDNKKWALQEFGKSEAEERGVGEERP